VGGRSTWHYNKKKQDQYNSLATKDDGDNDKSIGDKPQEPSPGSRREEEEH